MLCDENKPHPPQSVARHPPKNACGFLFAANASSPAPVKRLLPFALSLIFASVPLGHLPTKPPLSRFLQCLGINSASPKLCGNAAVQGARPRSCGRTLCPSTTPPSAARRPASTSTSPWARVAAVAGFMYFSFSPCSAATHARGGNIRHVGGSPA